MSNRTTRVGNLQSMLRLLEPLDTHAAGDPLEGKRRLLADVCRLIGEQVRGDGKARAGPLPADVAHLSPRMQQTLRALLEGHSEKQAAARIGVSQHTLHVYVKQLYKRYNVSSRSELMAKWVRR